MNISSSPSPNAYASEHKNRSRKGNDGSMYRSEPDKNGVYCWKKSIVEATSRAPARTAAAKAKARRAAKIRSAAGATST